jgi:hypothetical protein
VKTNIGEERFLLERELVQLNVELLTINGSMELTDGDEDMLSEALLEIKEINDNIKYVKGELLKLKEEE